LLFKYTAKEGFDLYFFGLHGQVKERKLAAYGLYPSTY